MHIMMDIIRIEMKVDTFVFANHQAEGSSVQRKQQRVQNRTLGDIKQKYI